MNTFRFFSWSTFARRSRGASLVLLALAGLACSPGTTIVSIDATPASLSISLAPSTPLEVATTPRQLDLIVGQSVSLSAIALNALGNPVGATGVVWTSATPTIASVTAGGVVAAVAAGSTEIVATLNGIDATLAVVVSEPPL